MAFRGNLKSMMTRLRNSRPFASSTVHSDSTRSGFKADLAPVYIVLGMCLTALSLGTHSVKQQLMYSPSVNVSKKKRETVAEVDYPDHAVASSDKFTDKSFLRKVANIQERKYTNCDSGHPDLITSPRKVESLKTVGVNPRQY